MDKDDHSDYGLDDSFDSNSPVIFINPCDFDGYNLAKKSPNSTVSNQSSEKIKAPNKENSKMNILSNVFIGRKLGKISSNQY